MNSPPPQGRLNVVIAGSGVAGLEAMIALRALGGERVDLTLLDAEDEYAYEPLSVGEPFGVSEVRRYPLERLAAEHGARFLRGWVTGVDPERRMLLTERAGEVPYDALLVALGARRVEALPDALTFHGGRNVPGVRDLLAALASGRMRRLAFVVPDGVVWPFPLYELALMTGSFALEHEIDAELVLVTPAPAPLALFGAGAQEKMAAMLAERHIEVRSGYRARAVAPGRVMLEPDGGALEADAVVALPRLVGPGVSGVPHDREGFIPVDRHGRVQGLEGIYAAGDCIDFPVKQGGLAAQQADAAAQAIASAAGADLQPAPFRPVLRGVLFAGAEREYLRSGIGEQGSADSAVEAHTLWWPPAKIAGRYLAPALGEIDTAAELEEMGDDAGVRVAVELPHDAAGTPELREF
jgi:sulfide:quinone oxidoreductase